jgi:hypothetical protein
MRSPRWAARGVPREAVDALSEAIDIIRAMWSGQRSVRVSGNYYTLSGTHPGPQPGPGLGIWLGAYGPRMLDLTGAKADGWLPSHAYLGLDRLRAASSRVDDAARTAGRDPAQLRKLYNIAGFIGAGSREPFTGSAGQWTEQLISVVIDYGMNGFAFWPTSDHDTQIARFAQEVVPAVREALVTA